MSSDFEQCSQFYKPKNTEQQADQIIDITRWSLGGDFDPYAEGTRSKYVVHCPNETEYPFLIPNHRYLYKKSFERKGGIIFHEQFWVEVIAYKIGKFLGIQVPPAFVACRNLPNSDQKEYACLIEWYHSYPSAKAARIDRGGDFMSALIPHYDRDKGAQHNFTSIIELFQTLGIEEWQNKWAKMLLLDALIGNTDRHQENWEVVSYFDLNDFNKNNLSPAFDNGTAMGYEVLEHKIPSRIQNIHAYMNKGIHHMRWEISDAKQIGHFDLLQKLITTYPQTQEVMAEILSHDISLLCEDIIKFSEYDLQNPYYCLTPQRADFIVKLLKVRFEKAKEIIGL